jgi:hypothetical protein
LHVSAFAWQAHSFAPDVPGLHDQPGVHTAASAHVIVHAFFPPPMSRQRPLGQSVSAVHARPSSLERQIPAWHRRPGMHVSPSRDHDAGFTSGAQHACWTRPQPGPPSSRMGGPSGGVGPLASGNAGAVGTGLGSAAGSSSEEQAARTKATRIEAVRRCRTGKLRSA